MQEEVTLHLYIVMYVFELDRKKYKEGGRGILRETNPLNNSLFIM